MQNQFHFGAQSQILVNPPHQVPNLIGGQVPPNPMGQVHRRCHINRLLMGYYYFYYLLQNFQFY